MGYCKRCKRHFNCLVFCFSQICRKGSCTATAPLTQQWGPSQSTLQNCLQSPPGQVLTGWDKDIRLTVHRVQNAGRKRRDCRRSSARQHKAIKLPFTTAGTAFPRHLHVLFESRGLCFRSLPYPPGTSSAFTVQAHDLPGIPYPYRALPSRRFLTPSRSSPSGCPAS